MSRVDVPLATHAINPSRFIDLRAIERNLLSMMGKKFFITLSVAKGSEAFSRID
jgi:hypothetical protein